jgi:hypothetical protein
LRASRGDAALFARLERELRAIPGVRAVRGNALTGSLLIEHDGPEAAMLAAASERGLFETVPGTGSAVSPAASGNLPSPLHLAAAGLAGAGVLQLARGRLFGTASENFWNAYRSYVITGRPWPSLLLAGLGAVQVVRGRRLLGPAGSLFFYAWRANRAANQRQRSGG